MHDPLRDKQADSAKIQEVMQRAAQAAIAEHHRAGRAVPVWQDGRVVWLGPDGEVPDRPTNGQETSGQETSHE